MNGDVLCLYSAANSQANDCVTVDVACYVRTIMRVSELVDIRRPNLTEGYLAACTAAATAAMVSPVGGT
jgi:hypothetical protein